MARKREIRNSMVELLISQLENKAQDIETISSLDAIIAAGFRADSIQGIQFRQWATSVLRQYAIRGYVLDKKRMENGTFLSDHYFRHLQAEIQEIRLSERHFYQKLIDLYATSMDYNKDAPTTRLFFSRIRSKMMEQADADKEHQDRILTALLDVAESRAERHIPMTMEDWAKRIVAQLFMKDY